ncbi:Os03g0226500 [Oryza sativa Japonica Group]|uniref:Os03g0226500 protein n=1 Tax=Oryza sativa subsp. japonica TaxID=39947 RepID=C7J0G3_ORYSJ|nr:Os03g0226500 [Oryza sativa Japonica Group]|eukprot:NP_001173323.1 Os03g0226500 [Oryza sativa Japonica Group]
MADGHIWLVRQRGEECSEASTSFVIVQISSVEGIGPNSPKLSYMSGTSIHGTWSISEGVNVFTGRNDGQTISFVFSRFI